MKAASVRRGVVISFMLLLSLSLFASFASAQAARCIDHDGLNFNTYSYITYQNNNVWEEDDDECVIPSNYRFKNTDGSVVIGPPPAYVCRLNTDDVFEPGECEVNEILYRLPSCGAGNCLVKETYCNNGAPAARYYRCPPDSSTRGACNQGTCTLNPQIPQRSRSACTDREARIEYNSNANNRAGGYQFHWEFNDEDNIVVYNCDGNIRSGIIPARSGTINIPSSFPRQNCNLIARTPQVIRTCTFDVVYPQSPQLPRTRPDYSSTFSLQELASSTSTSPPTPSNPPRITQVDILQALNHEIQRGQTVTFIIWGENFGPVSDFDESPVEMQFVDASGNVQLSITDDDQQHRWGVTARGSQMEITLAPAITRNWRAGAPLTLDISARRIGDFEVSNVYPVTFNVVEPPSPIITETVGPHTSGFSDMRTLLEGSSQTHRIGDRDYEVRLIAVRPNEAQFNINGETLPFLNTQNAYGMWDGTIFGVPFHRLADGTTLFVTNSFYQDSPGGVRSAKYFLMRPVQATTSSNIPPIITRTGYPTEFRIGVDHDFTIEFNGVNFGTSPGALQFLDMSSDNDITTVLTRVLFSITPSDNRFRLYWNDDSVEVLVSENFIRSLPRGQSNYAVRIKRSDGTISNNAIFSLNIVDSSTLQLPDLVTETSVFNSELQDGFYVVPENTPFTIQGIVINMGRAASQPTQASFLMDNYDTQAVVVRDLRIDTFALQPNEGQRNQSRLTLPVGRYQYKYCADPDNTVQEIRKMCGLKPSHDSGVDVCPPCAQSASNKIA
ncbi:hypothetical protein HYY71_06675 [Candidatus Woesearchaeota archaeon]|nr:hypothetical protein [Candidatus Woesearchaeota archaeon]